MVGAWLVFVNENGHRAVRKTEGNLVERRSAWRLAPTRAACKKRQRHSLLGRADGFGVVLVNGQVRFSTVVFILCLIEATLWTSCLLSSHSALKSDTLEAEHYLLRENENLKGSSLNRGDPVQNIKSNHPNAGKQSYLVKQHNNLERLWAQRLRNVWSNNLNWNTPKLRENFQLEASILDKGIPGPFAGVNAIH